MNHAQKSPVIILVQIFKKSSPADSPKKKGDLYGFGSDGGGAGGRASLGVSLLSVQFTASVVGPRGAHGGSVGKGNNIFGNCFCA